MIWLVAALVLSATPPARHSTQSCDILHAEYDAPATPRFHLRFVRLASSAGVVSDIGLHIFSDDPRAELWYYPDEGSAPRISLISTTDPTATGWHAEPDGGVRPHGTATLIAMRDDATIWPSAPSSQSPPPRYVIVPELGEVYRHIVRYWPAAFVFRRCQH